MNVKKVFAYVTFTNSTQKSLDIWRIHAGKVIAKTFNGENLFQNTCTHLLEMKKKNLEGIFFDLFKHNDPEFLIKLRKDFAEFCEDEGLLSRWIFLDIFFSTMLLYFSEEFKNEDTVIISWIKNDKFVFHKYKNGYLTQLDQIKSDDKGFEKKFDEILEGHTPKFTVMCSTNVPSGIKKNLRMKGVKMLKCTFLECLEKCASNFLVQLLHRPANCGWNFKVQFFNYFKILISSETGNFKLQSSDEPLPSKSSIELPKSFFKIKGTTKTSPGNHFDYHKDTKRIAVEVGEDGFVEMLFPERFRSIEFSVFELNDSNEYVFYKSSQSMEDFIYVTTSNFAEKTLQLWKVVGESCFKKEFGGATSLQDLKEYLQKYRSTAFDGIAFNLYKHSDPGFIWNTREDLITFCKLHKIQFKFVTEESLFISMLLMKSEIHFDVKKFAVVGYLNFEKKEFNLFKIKVLRTKFDIVEKSSHKDLKAIINAIKDDAFKNFKPDCVVISANEKTANVFKENFENVKHFKDNFLQCFISTSSQIFIQIFTTKNSKWHFVSPQSPCYKLKAETPEGMTEMLGNDEIKKYPCQKSLPPLVNTVRLKIDSETEVGYFMDYSEYNHVMLDIAEDGFTHFNFPLKFAAFDGDSSTYKEFAKKLNEIVTNRKPIIIFPEDIAILFVFENGTYAPIKIDGRKELRMVIDFSEYFPVVGEMAAQKRFGNSFAVYDIMKITKMDPTKLELKDYWSFDLVRHETFPVMFQFQTPEGMAHAPPSHLLTIILKQLAKAYRENTGHKLKDVMVPDIYDNERVLNEVKDAFELAHIKLTVLKL